MRLIQLFFVIVIVLVIMWFLTQNVDQSVKELAVFQYSFYDVNLIFILFGTFAFGVLMGFIIPVFQVIGAKNEIRRKKKEIKKLNSELNDLRNVGIEGELDTKYVEHEVTEPEVIDSTEEQESSDEEKSE